ncbi:MAG: nSTAND1 domain-containing NTPase, partial [Anaerolineales bacterium]
MSTRTPAGTPAISFDQFTTFGDLLKYLRRRAGLTQRELSIAVGYSDAQISRLEQNQRLPDIPTIAARFIPALDLDDDPGLVKRLQELAATVRREDAPASGLPPFKGLLYFDEADADLFFGREALTARLVARVIAPPSTHHAPRFLAVIGASGSGKSSVLRAGLISALRWNPDTASWPVHILTPTTHPLEALATSLLGETKSSTTWAALAYEFARDPSGLNQYLQRAMRLGREATTSHVLLVVDQFEELFTLCRSEAERRAFVDNLLTAAFEPDGRMIVVIALRADFYAHCADFPKLREALAQHQDYIGTMSAEELRCAIEEPARHGSWEFEQGLVELLLKDVGADGTRPPEPGALPLLSHALLETWQRRRGRTLTLSGYIASGGVRAAIAETAEAVFRDQLDVRQQAVARNIFLRLTALGDDEEVIWTRRRVTFDELIPTEAETVMVREVLTCLADARLITTSDAAAEVAHEALLREWPRLSEWLANNRASIRLQRQLTHAAAEWRKASHDPGFLLMGARLAQLENLATFSTVALTQDERAYLEASLAGRERREAEERERQQRELAAAQKLVETERARADSERQRAEEQGRYLTRVRTRNRAIAVAGAIALILAVLAGAFGLQSNQSAARAEAEKRLATARELAASALTNLAADPEISLLLALQAVDTTYSVDKTVLLEAEQALHAAVQASHLQLSLPASSASGIEVISAVFSPDGKRLATIDGAGMAKVWDVSLGAAARQSRDLLTLPGLGPGNGVIGLEAIAFSPDGTRLATAGDFSVVRVWDAVSGKELLAVPYRGGGVFALAFSPDGQRIAVGGDGGE